MTPTSLNSAGSPLTGAARASLDALKATLRNDAAMPVDLAHAAEDARGLAASCGAAIERLSAERHRQLVEIDDEQLAQLDGAIAGETRNRDRALALADALEVRKGEAEAVFADRKRDADIAAAHAAVQAFETAARKLWPGVVANVRKLIEIEATARVACQDAAAHGERIDPMAWRYAEDQRPATVLDAQRITLWANEDGTALPLQYQNHVMPYGKGRGRDLPRSDVAGSTVEYHQAEFVHVRFREATTARGFPPLATSINLPALLAGENVAWNPAEGGHAASVPGILAALKVPLARPSPVVVEELVPVARYERFLASRGLSEAAETKAA